MKQFNQVLEVTSKCSCLTNRQQTHAFYLSPWVPSFNVWQTCVVADYFWGVLTLLLQCLPYCCCRAAPHPQMVVKWWCVTGRTVVHFALPALQHRRQTPAAALHIKTFILVLSLICYVIFSLSLCVHLSVQCWLWLLMMLLWDAPTGIINGLS